MLKKLLQSFGVGASAASAAKPAEPFSPYSLPASNLIYNLLFCDAPVGFAPKPGQAPAPWQSVLFGEPVDPQAVSALASDPSAEGRVRALAYNWLRQHGHAVPPKQLLGVIVEVPLSGGLDVLAAFSDGAVRYINQTGHVAVFEGVPALQPAVGALLKESQAIVDQIGPWGKDRLPPPGEGKIRLSFLVSDGLYFGEGKMAVMQREPMGAATIQRATELLQLVVGMSGK
jgi:hypothetical protein